MHQKKKKNQQQQHNYKHHLLQVHKWRSRINSRPKIAEAFAQSVLGRKIWTTKNVYSAKTDIDIR